MDFFPPLAANFALSANRRGDLEVQIQVCEKLKRLVDFFTLKKKMLPTQLEKEILWLTGKFPLAIFISQMCVTLQVLFL